MNPIAFALRRPIRTLTLVFALVSGGFLGLSSRTGLDTFAAVNTPKIYTYLDQIGIRARQIREYVVARYESYFHKHEERHEEPRKVVATSPKLMDVTISQPYVCQIHSQRHISVKALDTGYLQEIKVVEGQAVKGPHDGKPGDVLFKILPVLYKTRADAELAEARLADLEYKFTEKLAKEKKAVSENEVLLYEAKRDRARAKADQAQAELSFTDVTAPFDGIVDRLHEQLGSLIKEGELLTTLSDNRLMWVYFNVPERAYLEYMASLKEVKEDQKIELELANHTKFPESCQKLIVEAQFNNETGNIPFRADFPNPHRLLRHGQTGTIWIHRNLHDAVVIPQRATYEILDKKYVYVVDKDDAVKQRGIVIKYELDDIYVIETGVEVGDRIVLEGVRQVRDGDKVEYEFRSPEEVMGKLKNHAE
jgi:membrane fusion protein (multidrug efflux system)